MLTKKLLPLILVSLLFLLSSCSRSIPGGSTEDRWTYPSPESFTDEEKIITEANAKVLMEELFSKNEDILFSEDKALGAAEILTHVGIKTIVELDVLEKEQWGYTVHVVDEYSGVYYLILDKTGCISSIYKDELYGELIWDKLPC